ncbi:hypothetical protein ACJRO7_020818 [Eucalyptus globulus]|uniref:Peptidase A1 domain-containing protein n=1 Tax=Eucalyptus globulus TaxID=34317 RepID=A0ABD3KJD1_EUCGL
MATSYKPSHPLRPPSPPLPHRIRFGGGCGFTADPILNDSPSSPFHDPLATRSDCMHGAAKDSSEVVKIPIDSTTGHDNCRSSTLLAFQCGNGNVGGFDNAGLCIIGLGGSGPFSLISQIEDSIGGMSKISFGEDSVVSGPGAFSTPLVSIGPDLFHFVNLEGGKMRSQRPDKFKIMVIDSGTSLTFMPMRFFDSLESAISMAIALPRIDVPIVTLHFTGSADMALNTGSTFLHFAENPMCVTINPMNELPILENFAQMGFTVGFDMRS